MPETTPEIQILIIDPEEELLSAITRILSRFGHKIQYASKATEAIKLLSKANKLDLIIVDNNLPDISGIELIRSLAKSYPDIPYILVANELIPTDMKEAHNIGAKKVFIKPLNLARFILEINRLAVKAIEAPEEEKESTQIQTGLEIPAEFFFTIKDISETGCCIRSHFQLSHNDIIVLEAPDLAHKLATSALTPFPVKIANCSPQPDSKVYNIGAEFIGMPEELKLKIRNACLSVKGFKI